MRSTQRPKRLACLLVIAAPDRIAEAHSLIAQVDHEQVRRFKPTVWRKQEADLATARSALADVEARRRELRTERARLERIKHARDDVGKRAARLEEQAALASARRLPDSFSERRRDAETPNASATPRKSLRASARSWRRSSSAAPRSVDRTDVSVHPTAFLT